MAAGDAKHSYGDNIAANAFFAIQPGAGEQWVLTNIFYSGSVEIYFRDDTLGQEIGPIIPDSGAGAMLGLNIHMTERYFVRVKAISAARDISFTAVQTK